jgi:hypothetical protein
LQRKKDFVSDVIQIHFGRSRTVDHFEAAESMDGTPAWRIRIQPRRSNVAASARSAFNTGGNLPRRACRVS